MEQLTLDLGITYADDALTDRLPQTLAEKIEHSKKVLRLASELSKTYYQAPLILTYSGGKDSDVMLNLALDCLDPTEFEVLNSHTTVDAPETVYYIREVFSKLREQGIKATINIPKYADGTPMTMWNLIINKGIPPTRLVRYCCQELKETHTPNRIAALGVRAAESTKRKGRDAFGVRGGHTGKLHFFHTTTRRKCIVNHKRLTTLCGIAH